MCKFLFLDHRDRISIYLREFKIEYQLFKILLFEIFIFFFYYIFLRNFTQINKT